MLRFSTLRACFILIDVCNCSHVQAVYMIKISNSSPDTMKYSVLQDLEIASSPLDTEHAMMMANFGRRFARGIGLILSSS